MGTWRRAQRGTVTSFPTLTQIFDKPQVAAALLFCMGAIGGQVMHAIKKWADGEVDCISAWLLGNPKRAVSAAIGNGAGMLIFIQTGVLGSIYQTPDGWWALCLLGFMNGFTADSALNKATRSAWTPEKREAAKL